MSERSLITEASEQLTPEEEAEETEAWAKPLSQLWQNRPPNFEAEKEYNRTMAQQPPYCAVCMLFQAYQVWNQCYHRGNRVGAAVVYSFKYVGLHTAS